MVQKILEQSQIISGSGKNGEKISGICRYSGIYQTENDGLLLDAQSSVVALSKILPGFVSIIRNPNSEEKIDWTGLDTLLQSQDQRFLLVDFLIFRWNCLGETAVDPDFMRKRMEIAAESLIVKCSTSQQQDHWLGLGLVTAFPDQQGFAVLSQIKSRLLDTQYRSLETLIDIGKKIP
ncbi:MAG: hypothetical protein GY795_04790 [Desulfobacterales bacterium]|nr:hypothetical protein [Desulfobacterales bacterium]